MMIRALCAALPPVFRYFELPKFLGILATFGLCIMVCLEIFLKFLTLFSPWRSVGTFDRIFYTVLHDLPTFYCACGLSDFAIIAWIVLPPV
ncbi:hypothetical protein B0H19DRAFT_580077 [Mycena capillaripes]|nr:hypothetical protein B0H19DRAFT_580077 [Mycena capillaripes]